MRSSSRKLLSRPRGLLRGVPFIAGLLLATTFSFAGDKPEILPLDQVKPGMKGVAYTIFAGDKVEKFDLEVIGVMPNLLGPKQSIILVELKGPKVEHTGVVAGMSGSPVYIEGKLAGALSLKFGIFTKEPLGGVTPIENVLEVQTAAAAEKTANAGLQGDATAMPEPGAEAQEPPARHYQLPAELAKRVGASSEAYLSPIETPLVFSGFQRAALERFAGQLAAYGMVATQGGTAAAQPDDAKVQPGDMVGMVLVKGDLSVSASCSVTLVSSDRVLVCGHPLFGFGPVSMPMARAHVLTTLSSELASTKIVNMGGVIGTFTEDRLTAVMGRLGPAPRMIPVDLTITTPAQEKKFRFELIENAKLTPVLVALSTFNGLAGNTAYSEGTTLRLTGAIEIAGHSGVNLENMFAPTDTFVPDALSVALSVQNVFTRIFSNPYEPARIERIALRLESIPERRWATIESAWSEKSEALPGETVNVKVLLRPYRGAPIIQNVPITIPPQAARGSTLRILVSDSETLNRMSRLFTFAPQGRLAGLEQLITLLNRERRNNRLYVTLLQPTPTLLVEDKELPNAPLSEINVLDQRHTSGSPMLLRESTVGEWSVLMKQVISGLYSLNITLK
ncbi:MAG TPA: SpoIVB peptidase S55 domain-containing protein [Candidatus Acidoferrales bacterium]|nr:SpoIVB peptidase S55 domain-containing protein [Candidatus Acidoferrales bacterium]